MAGIKITREIIEKSPGTSKGLDYENPYRDWTSANRILMRGWGGSDPPAEMKPLQEPIRVPASLIVEAGSPHPFRGG